MPASYTTSRDILDAAERFASTFADLSRSAASRGISRVNSALLNAFSKVYRHLRHPSTKSAIETLTKLPTAVRVAGLGFGLGVLGDSAYRWLKGSRSSNSLSGGKGHYGYTLGTSKTLFRRIPKDVGVMALNKRAQFDKLAAGISTGRVNGFGMGDGGVSLGGLHAGYATGNGVNTIGVGSRNGGFSASLSNAAIHNGLLGAGLGAAAGVAHEALRDPEYRKHYLKSVLLGLLAGGAAGIGATMVGNLPDYSRKVAG